MKRPRVTPAPPRFAALDLGTNNCRLLICTPRKNGFRVIDSYSEIVRLGEGVGATGALSQSAIDRTLRALGICAGKMARRRVRAYQCVATQACRVAHNGEAFLNRVRSELGLSFEIISPEQEARLSVEGCADLMGSASDKVLVFDIGGGSTELSWVNGQGGVNGQRGVDGQSGVNNRRRENGSAAGTGRRHATSDLTPDIVSWASLPVGVVTLSEQYGGQEITQETYGEMVALVEGKVRACGQIKDFEDAFRKGGGYLLGTSGTVTSLASVHLNLDRYSRQRVDGLWLSPDEVLTVAENLRHMRYEERVRIPTIGPDRADLVVPGSAILEGVLRVWPSERIRVADRGLREGILRRLVREYRQGPTGNSGLGGN